MLAFYKAFWICKYKKYLNSYLSSESSLFSSVLSKKSRSSSNSFNGIFGWGNLEFQVQGWFLHPHSPLNALLLASILILRLDEVVNYLALLGTISIPGSDLL